VSRPFGANEIEPLARVPVRVDVDCGGVAMRRMSHALPLT
jgi:hypothetical protein